ncbi:MAG: response regulator [Anaerolineae bacterium]|nr:response regulator [Anaerolineae bacterium]
MNNKRVLVVDDATDIRSLLADYVLGPAGYEVLTAEDGAKGLEAARRFAPQLMVLDYEMPGLTGLELVKTLKKDGIETPAILITSDSSEDLVIKAMRIGVRDFLRKPFEPEDLLEAVKRAWPEKDEALRPALSPADVLERRVRELRTLNKLGKSLAAQLDLEQVLKQVVDAAVILTEAEEGSLLLLDEKTGELYMRAAQNFDEEMARHLRLKVSDSLAGEAMRSRTPITLSSANALKIATAYLVKDLIYVPLILNGEAVGVLGVDNRFVNRSFDRDHVRLLTALADCAVVAIRNASLYEKTQHERDTLDAVLRNAEDVVILVDTEYEILLCNPAARRAFGISNNGSVGKPLSKVITHQDVLALFEKDCVQGRDCTSEIQLENGKTLYAHLTVIEGVGRAVVMQDISHLKELDRIKSDFVTTVSHDLRSPLTAILGYVELLGRVGQINEAQGEFINRIVFSVQSITALISDLLELGRIEAGFDVDRKPTPLRFIIRYAVEAQRQHLESRRQALEVDVPDTLPDVLGNPLRLKQMVTNLLDNAIKYTPEAGQVKIRARGDGDLVILEVSDTGIGIPPAQHTRIFEKFYRADNAGGIASGTGLGLSIVKTIVDQHDGRVWVDSTVGEGSTFTVVLPAYAPEQS